MALPTFYTIDQMLRDAKGASTAQVLRIFRDSPFLNSETFKGVPGASDDYEIEANLPTIEKRALNQDWTDSGGGRTGLENEALRIYGLKLGEDEAANQMGISGPAKQNELAARALRLTLEFDAWYGDPEVDRLTVGGFQYWAQNSGDIATTSISQGITVGGAALSIFTLREAIDQCIGPRKIVLGSSMLNRLTGASESVGVAGTITFEKDDFGKRRAMFDGWPLIPMEKDVSQVRIGGFIESDQPAGGSNDTATSIYILGEAYYWFQNGGPDMTELSQTNVQTARRLMWLIANAGPRYSVIRLKHIGNLAPTA